MIIRYDRALARNHDVFSVDQFRTGGGAQVWNGQQCCWLERATERPLLWHGGWIWLRGTRAACWIYLHLRGQLLLEFLWSNFHPFRTKSHLTRTRLWVNWRSNQTRFSHHTLILKSEVDSCCVNLGVGRVVGWDTWRQCIYWGGSRYFEGNWFLTTQFYRFWFDIHDFFRVSQRKTHRKI